MVVFVFGFGWMLFRGDSGLHHLDLVRHGGGRAAPYDHGGLVVRPRRASRSLAPALAMVFPVHRLVPVPPEHVAPAAASHPDPSGPGGRPGAPRVGGARVRPGHPGAERRALLPWSAAASSFRARPWFRSSTRSPAFSCPVLSSSSGRRASSSKTLLGLVTGRQQIRRAGRRYTAEFHSKWIEGPRGWSAADRERLDIQSLADLANSYDVVSEMKPVPIGKDTIVSIVGAAVVPLLPLAHHGRAGGADHQAALRLAA